MFCFLEKKACKRINSIKNIHIYMLSKKDIHSNTVLNILIICGILLKNMIEPWDIEDYII